MGRINISFGPDEDSSELGRVSLSVKTKDTELGELSISMNRQVAGPGGFDAASWAVSLSGPCVVEIDDEDEDDDDDDYDDYDLDD